MKKYLKQIDAADHVFVDWDIDFEKALEGDVVMAVGFSVEDKARNLFQFTPEQVKRTTAPAGAPPAAPVPFASFVDGGIHYHTFKRANVTGLTLKVQWQSAQFKSGLATIKVAVRRNSLQPGTREDHILILRRPQAIPNGDQPLKCVAVDFGTSNTLVAAQHSRAVALPNEPDFDVPELPYAEGQEIVPTRVLWQKHPDKYAIGLQASLQLNHAARPEQVFDNLKRYVQEGMVDETIILCDGQTPSHTFETTPRKQIEAFLRELAEGVGQYRKSKNVAGRLYGCNRLIVTHPVNWNESQRNIVAECFLKSWTPGEIEYIDEATAAGMWYLQNSLTEAKFSLEDYVLRRGLEHRFLVVDVGGGTTDIAAVRIRAVTSAGEVKKVEHLSLSIEATSGIDLAGNDVTLDLFHLVKSKLVALVENAGDPERKLARFVGVPEAQATQGVFSARWDAEKQVRIPTAFAAYRREGWSSAGLLKVRGIANCIFACAEEIKRSLGSDPPATAAALASKLRQILAGPTFAELAAIYNGRLGQAHEELAKIPASEVAKATTGALQKVVDRVVELSRDVVQSAKNSTDVTAGFSAVYLVGQSSRLKQLQLMLRQAVERNADIFDDCQVLVPPADLAKKVVVEGAMYFRGWQAFHREKSPIRLVQTSPRVTEYFFYVSTEKVPVPLFDRGEELKNGMIARDLNEVELKTLPEDLRIYRSITAPEVAYAVGKNELFGGFVVQAPPPPPARVAPPPATVIPPLPDPPPKAKGLFGLFKKKEEPAPPSPVSAAVIAPRPPAGRRIKFTLSAGGDMKIVIDGDQCNITPAPRPALRGFGEL